MHFNKGNRILSHLAIGDDDDDDADADDTRKKVKYKSSELPISVERSQPNIR